ncbi:hypothetical protein M513_08238 [Trichuris suis]|uniref:Uncharacterized protein n=1 Tax=Trichuris suis TaxID=68888 RepID=A0A085M129_9BILA|nr:hypothetical protein M513_08238 [Trichuris suis]
MNNVKLFGIFSSQNPAKQPKGHWIVLVFTVFQRYAVNGNECGHSARLVADQPTVQPRYMLSSEVIHWSARVRLGALLQLLAGIIGGHFNGQIAFVHVQNNSGPIGEQNP